MAFDEVLGGGEGFSFDYVARTPPVPVPEPSTWAMMLLGFAGLGYAGIAAQEGAMLRSLPSPPNVATTAGADRVRE